MVSIAAALLATAALLAACGGGSGSGSAGGDQGAIKSRLDSVVNHINAGDGKAILDDDVPASARRTCSDKDAKDVVNAARQALGGKLTVKSVDDVQVNGSKATAKVVFGTGVPQAPTSGAMTVPFVKSSGWKLDPGDLGGCNGILPNGSG
jgi:hypothetical protein